MNSLDIKFMITNCKVDCQCRSYPPGDHTVADDGGPGLYGNSHCPCPY